MVGEPICAGNNGSWWPMVAEPKSGAVDRSVRSRRADSARIEVDNRPVSHSRTPETEPEVTLRTKADWRSRLLAARRDMTDEQHAAEAELLSAAAVSAAASLTTPPSVSSVDHPRARVCCYVPFGREPGSIAMLDALREAGCDVLLPVVPSGPRRALDWARYRGPSSLVDGPYRLRQPAHPELGPEALASAALVLVPALAVDRRGVRLGRGAGWYDRSLALARANTPLVAVVRDSELVDTLPAERHDVLMSGALTPHHGCRALPLS